MSFLTASLEGFQRENPHATHHPFRGHWETRPPCRLRHPLDQDLPTAGSNHKPQLLLLPHPPYFSSPRFLVNPAKKRGPVLQVCPEGWMPLRMISSSAVAVEEVVARRGTHVSGAGGGVGGQLEGACLDLCNNQLSPPLEPCSAIEAQTI